MNKMNKKKLWWIQNIGIVLPLLYRAAGKKSLLPINNREN